MNRSNNVSQTPLNIPEEQVESQMSVTNKQTEEFQKESLGVSEWIDCMVAGHARMSTDPEYREEIENKLYNMGPQEPPLGTPIDTNLDRSKKQ